MGEENEFTHTQDRILIFKEARIIIFGNFNVKFQAPESLKKQTKKT